MSDNKAKKDRWRSDPNTVERRDRDRTGGNEQAGGITNRPLEKERENQEALPSRGQSTKENR